MKRQPRYSREVRERAVRLVLDNQGQHSSRWQTIMSISAKIGCSAHTLNEWVKKAEVDSGKPLSPNGHSGTFLRQFEGTGELDLWFEIFVVGIRRRTV